MAPQSELELGDSLAKSGRPREAEACYTRAIEADPSALAPRFRRAHVRLFELDDARGALDDLLFVQQHQHEGRPDAPPVSHLEHLLGEALFQLKRYHDAVEHFEDALSAGGTPAVWAEQHLRLAECWERLAHDTAMEEALDAFLELASRGHGKPEDIAWAQEELVRLRKKRGS